jgi:hypothetical protein
MTYLVFLGTLVILSILGILTASPLHLDTQDGQDAQDHQRNAHEHLALASLGEID